MKFSKRVKELMYKGVSLVLVMAVLAGVVMIPPKSSKAAVKTYRDNLVLEQGGTYVYYSVVSGSWKSTKPEVASADMDGIIYGLKLGKATLTGKDYDNNKYVVNITVIKPIHLQIKKVQVTKTSLKYTIKNLNKKAIKIEKKAKCDCEEALVSFDCKLKKAVTIKPKKTATIELTTDKKNYFIENGKRNFIRACINIVYDKKKVGYCLYPKKVKDTGKIKTQIGFMGYYYLDLGEQGTAILINNTKKVTWSVVSGKGCVTLGKKTNYSVVVIAKAEGTAKIQAKVGKKKYTCTIYVEDDFEVVEDDYVDDDDDDYYDDDDSDDSYDDDGYYDDEDYSDDE